MDRQASDIQRVASAAGDVLAFCEEPMPGATLWWSESQLASPVSYRSPIPAGLHLGCGIARIASKLHGGSTMAFLGPGASVLWVPPGEAPEVHTTLEGRQRTRACGVVLDQLDTDLVGDVLRELIADAREPRLLTSAAVPVLEIERLCAPVDGFFQGAARRLALQARVLQFAALLSASLNGEPAAPKTARHQRFVERARALLECRLSCPPDLSELARAVGLNPHSLNLAFRADTGMSIGAYLTERRLARALEYLEGGAGPTEAAAKVGYTPAHFSTAFKRRYGLSPSAVRPRTP